MTGAYDAVSVFVQALRMLRGEALPALNDAVKDCVNQRQEQNCGRMLSQAVEAMQAGLLLDILRTANRSTARCTHEWLSITHTLDPYA